jgi:hypothetical protein
MLGCPVLIYDAVAEKAPRQAKHGVPKSRPIRAEDARAAKKPLPWDVSKIWDSKRRIRRELQALPFVEKLRILERLRDDLILGLAHLRGNPKSKDQNPKADSGASGRCRKKER